MRHRLLASPSLALALLLVGSSARAQTTRLEVPPIVRIGFDSLKAAGFKAAVVAWMRGSPVEDTSQADQLVLSFGGVLEKYGAYQGYEVVNVLPIGEHVRRTYAVILLDRGPLYAYFDSYLRPSGWIIPSFLINAQPQNIFPPGMLTAAPLPRP